MTDNTTPAWATTLIETFNTLCDEVCGEAEGTRSHLARLELATDRASAAVDELDAQLAAVETRMGLRDGSQT